jgi:hypothetical protein
MHVAGRLQPERVAVGTRLSRQDLGCEQGQVAQTLTIEGEPVGSTGVHLQIAGLLGLALNQLRRSAELDELLREARPLADQAEQNWGPLPARLSLCCGWSRVVSSTNAAKSPTHEKCWRMQFRCQHGL